MQYPHLHIVSVDVCHAVCQQLLKQRIVLVASTGQRPGNVGHALHDKGRAAKHTRKKRSLGVNQLLPGDSQPFVPCWRAVRAI